MSLCCCRRWPSWHCTCYAILINSNVRSNMCALWRSPLSDRHSLPYIHFKLRAWREEQALTCSGGGVWCRPLGSQSPVQSPQLHLHQAEVDLGWFPKKAKKLSGRGVIVFSSVGLMEILLCNLGWINHLLLHSWSEITDSISHLILLLFIIILINKNLNNKNKITVEM